MEEDVVEVVEELADTSSNTENPGVMVMT